MKGKNGHAVKNSAEFVEIVKVLEIPPGRKMLSFDVSALFTSIPIDFALQAVRSKLSQDTSWHSLTPLNLEQILRLLEFCLSTTYFRYQGSFYKQKFGAPMGSPISPGVADLAMESFEEEMLQACPDYMSPEVWLRYVDDTFAVLHEYVIEEFTTFLNSRNTNIQFTRELEEEGKLAFLDSCVHLLDDGSLKTTVYRKATHTDQYLNWESNHHLDHKRSVVRTLLNRADTHISDPLDKQAEIVHVKSVLKANGYQDWSFKVPNQPDKSKRVEHKQNKEKTTSIPPIGLPYIQGLSEELQRIFGDHGITVFHRPFNTIRSMLVHPKDKTEKQDKCGVVYQVPCASCPSTYIGETARSMGKRYEEHAKSDKESAVREHTLSSGHSISFEDVRILACETHYNSRKIREALEIYKAKPSLNRDQGVEIPPVLLQLLQPSQPAPTHNPRGPPRVGTRHRTNSL